jgi:hypothetical protein
MNTYSLLLDHHREIGALVVVFQGYWHAAGSAYILACLFALQFPGLIPIVRPLVMTHIACPTAPHLMIE